MNRSLLALLVPALAMLWPAQPAAAGPSVGTTYGAWATWAAGEAYVHVRETGYSQVTYQAEVSVPLTSTQCSGKGHKRTCAGTTSYCHDDVQVDGAAWRPDANLEQASLQVSTACGFVDVSWTATGLAG